MGKRKYFIFFMLLFLLAIPALSTTVERNIPLLALINKDDKIESGLLAGLSLKVIPGKEKVYLQTFPMTQISTQVSMRFAEQIACDEYEFECSKYDFLYTITAVPGTIGGPSAGVAAAVLTVSVLSNKPLNKKIAVTGTINSGGLIGPVGGLDKKIIVAAENGITEVLIPFGMMEYKLGNNLTVNLKKLGEELNITVKEIGTLEEAVEIILGIKKKKKSAILKIDKKYINKMKKVAEQLCQRTEDLKKEIKLQITKENFEKLSKSQNSLRELSIKQTKNKSYSKVSEENYTQKAKESFEKEDYYSAASYCFRSNVAIRKKIFENLTEKEVNKALDKLYYVLEKLKENTKKVKIRTLTDIETYMAVMERIEEAEILLKSIKDDKENQRDLAALITERVTSAIAWSQFFDLNYNTQIILQEDKIKKSCQAKISEAEERYNYVKVLFKTKSTSKLRESINSAYTSMREEDYIMCLYKASKSKAESDVILALQGITEVNFNRTMQLKLNAAEEAISKTLSKGSFPIISYSYYEYSKNLLDSEKAISALFAEYALELANIDLYFKERQSGAITVIKGADLKETEKKIQKEAYKWKIMVTSFFIFLLLFVWIFYEIKSKKRLKEMKMQKRKKLE